MKKNFKKRLFISTVLSSIILSGCKGKSNDIINIKETESEASAVESSGNEEINIINITLENESTVDKENKAEEIVPTLPVDTEDTISIKPTENYDKSNNETIKTNIYESKTADEILKEEKINEIKIGFKKNLEEIKVLAQSNEKIKVKSLGKEYVQTLIDFLFYGEDIKGYTINDCNSIVKEEIFLYLKELDLVISNFDRDYKEQLGERYAIISNFSKRSYTYTKNFIIEKIGKEKYNDIITKKDIYWGRIKNETNKYSKKLINILDNKYQEWKNDEETL